MLVLLSDEVELERQQQEIRLTNEFLSYQQTAADAYPLLLNWHKHQQVQKELREFRHFREVIDVELDLKICGELNVVQYGNSPVAKENAGGNIRHITAATQQAGKSPKKNLITARRTSVSPPVCRNYMQLYYNYVI
jgi:hypothetical protein